LSVLWFEITARVVPKDVEGVSTLMREVAPGGVTVEEPITILGPEMGFKVRHGEPVFVRAYLPSSELGAVLTEQLRRDMQEQFPAVELTAKPLYEEDWAVSWREFFGPVDYGGRLVVVPSWIDHPLGEGQMAIKLDPGQAFGTGHHETTRLCLAGLDEFLAPGGTVLDVGTGSGVLTIAALLLGASDVHAVDVDPVAIRVAEENLAENGLSGRATLKSGALPEDHPGRYDLVVANISTAANLALLPLYARLLRADGRLLLSGILAEDGHRFQEAAPSLGLEFVLVREERDWCFLVFRR